MRLGLTRRKAENLASKLNCHAIQNLPRIIVTRHALRLLGTSGKFVAGDAVVERSRMHRLPGAILTTRQRLNSSSDFSVLLA